MNLKSKLDYFVGVLLVLSLMCVASCNKDENSEIRLYYASYDGKSDPVEGNRIRLLLPASTKAQLVILGGDGSYNINNSDETVVNIAIESKHINITPLSPGNSTVAITDNSGGSYILNIEILYRTLNFIIDNQDVIVIGDKLSEVQKVEIQQKAALTLPVNINGGFSFIYNLDKQRGEVLIYKDKYGENGVQSTFEEIETETLIGVYRSLVILIDGKKREFVLDRYNARMPNNDMLVPIAFKETLTDQFKADYPDVEWVYTQQRLIHQK